MTEITGKYHVWIYLCPDRWVCDTCSAKTKNATAGNSAKRTCPGKKKG